MHVTPIFGQGHLLSVRNAVAIFVEVDIGMRIRGGMGEKTKNKSPRPVETAILSVDQRPISAGPSPRMGEKQNQSP
jgi:hypothetical protein